MREHRGFAVLDGTALKLIAMLSMVLDHVGDNFFPEQVWMRALGRIAMPVFAFCLAEGYSHTHDKKRYLLRMGLFACLSEVPFDLVTAHKVLEFGHQNIMLTFFWAILGLMCFEGITAKGGWLRMAAGVVALLFFLGASLFLGVDYNMVAVGLVFSFYLLRERPLPLRCLISMAWHTLLRNKGLYWFGLLGFLPIFLYNGKRGRGLKWLFYLFYPCHLLLIWAVREFIC